VETPEPPMDDPGYAPPPMMAPPPPPPATPRYAYLGSPRYAYLAGRLRERQITMEEATELFGILQGALSAAFAPPTPARESAAVAGGPPSGPAVAPPRAGSPVFTLTDEDLGIGLIALGAGAGLLAAVLKRAAEGPKGPPPK
jgi:hypothetical protein